MRTYVARFDKRRVQRAAVLTTGFASALWICGCAETGNIHAPAGAATTSSPAEAPVPTAAPTSPAPPAPAEPVVPARPVEPAVVAPTAATPVAAAAQPVVKAKKPAADAAPMSKPPAPAVVTQPASPAAMPAAPLDLTALKQRLRDTNAIGVFTKLALKNQVDDLLDRFRQYYGGQVKITLPELRQSYELLVQKVLALLQDSDPSLAREIVASREAIWGLLADRQKFATL
jgi:hypothetical protein